ncbi:nucleoside hydrolase [Microbacterium saperdae]
MRVLDTDIGTDVDDLIALVTSWGSGISFDAITTVYGDTSLRAAIVGDAYSRAGRFAPRIVAGEGRALSGRPVFWAGHEGAALVDDPERREPADPGDAARLLASAEEVLAIGPLTNLAAALRSGSSPATRRIVVMGGDFSGAAEHNVICDVAAADDVFRSGAPIDVVGTDQTERVRLDRGVLDRLPSTPVGELLRGEIGRFRRFMEAESNAPHDALAVLLLERPDRFEMERGIVHVETAANRAGHVHFERDANGPHRVVVDVDVDALREDIVSRMMLGAAAG